jgi:hypothetical protein
MADYKIKSIKTDKSSIPLRKCMIDGVLPKFPFSIGMVGRSGSGKTCALINLLTREEFYKHYFHYIVVFSPTALSVDDTYKELKLPNDCFKATFTKEDLETIIENRKKLIEDKGIAWVAKNSRVLLILDDIICEREFINSPEMLKCFALLRHYLVSVIILVQSLTKIQRAIRINLNAMVIFPSSRNEIEIILDEVCPPQLTKKQFLKVIEYCTDGRYDFLYINNHAEPDKRIRKNFDEVIDIKKYKV